MTNDIELREVSGEMDKREIVEEYLLYILEKCDLKEVEGIDIVKVTSTENSVVSSKWNVVKNALGVNCIAGGPVDFDDPKFLEVDPRVNWIHGYMNILNVLKSIRRMQVDGRSDSELIEGCVEKVVSYIEDPSFYRKKLSDGKLVETYMREAGSKGINPSRRVSLEEMMTMLEYVKSRFVSKDI